MQASNGSAVHIKERRFAYNDKQPRRSKSTNAKVASSLAVGRGLTRQVSSQSDQSMTGNRTLPRGARSTSVRCDRAFEPPRSGPQDGRVGVSYDLETALDLAQARARILGADEVIVAGGGNLYESLIDRVQRMQLFMRKSAATRLVSLVPLEEVCPERRISIAFCGRVMSRPLFTRSGSKDVSWLPAVSPFTPASGG